jgi:hypothetical protein
VIGAPLILTAEILDDLKKLRAAAMQVPVNVRSLSERLQDKRLMKQHRRQMDRQTVCIPGPWPFFVTYSLETGHPGGAARHMSMSVKRDGRVPHPEALKLIAAELGFEGDMQEWTVYPEKLSDGGMAINVVQIVASPAGNA